MLIHKLVEHSKSLSNPEFHIIEENLIINGMQLSFIEIFLTHHTIILPTTILKHSIIFDWTCVCVLKHLKNKTKNIDKILHHEKKNYTKNLLLLFATATHTHTSRKFIFHKTRQYTINFTSHHVCIQAETGIFPMLLNMKWI